LDIYDKFYHDYCFLYLMPLAKIFSYKFPSFINPKYQVILCPSPGLVSSTSNGHEQAGLHID